MRAIMIGAAGCIGPAISRDLKMRGWTVAARARNDQSRCLPHHRGIAAILRRFDEPEVLARKAVQVDAVMLAVLPPFDEEQPVKTPLDAMAAQ